MELTADLRVEVVPPPTLSRWDRIRHLIAWAGIATLTVLSLLAVFHFVEDVAAVFPSRGSRLVFVHRVAPTLSIALAAAVLAAAVAWLAGRGRRGEIISVTTAMVTLVGVRTLAAATLDSHPFGESFFYDQIARSILAGEWDLMGRPMGYPVLLSAVYSVVDDPQLALEALNMLFSILAGVAVLFLARALYGPRVATLALLGYAFWPAATMMVAVRMPQSAYDFAIVATAWTALATPPGWRGSVLTGLMLGFAQWLRPTTPILLPAFAIARIWSGGKLGWMVRSTVLPMLAAFLLVLLPVVVHNLERTGELSFSTSEFAGQSLYLGTHIESGGQWDAEASAALIELAGPEPGAVSAMGMRLGLARIMEDPVGIAALAIRKQDTLWGHERYGVQYAISGRLVERPMNPLVTAPLLLSQGFYALVLVTATAGMVMRRRKPDTLVALVTLLVWAVSLTHALLEVRDRYHSYVVPLLLPLSALALAAAWVVLSRTVSRRRHG